MHPFFTSHVEVKTMKILSKEGSLSMRRNRKLSPKITDNIFNDTNSKPKSGVKWESTYKP